jgi:hypothetical protein
MFEVWLGKIVKCAFGVKDDREEYFEQYKEYEIYLVPRQEGVWDCSIYNYRKQVKRAEDIHLSKDEIVKLAKEWIDEL